jgi:hypothetical protein
VLPPTKVLELSAIEIVNGLTVMFCVVDCTEPTFALRVVETGELTADPDLIRMLVVDSPHVPTRDTEILGPVEKLGQLEELSPAVFVIVTVPVIV